MPDASHPVDAELLLAQAGWVRSLARRLLRDADLAEDVLQETWIAALERGPGEDGEGGEGGERGLRAWLAVVARNFALRRRRDELVRARHERASAERRGAEAPDEVERMRLQRLLADQVLGLDEPYRSAVILRHLDGLSPRAIARRQGIREDAARKRISRGLALLRARLDRELGDRSTWCAALAVLAWRPGWAGSAAATGTAGGAEAATAAGAMAMGIKLLGAGAAAALVALGAYLWLERARPAAPRTEPVGNGRAAAELEGAAVARPAARAEESRETAAPADVPVEPAGALASADRERDLAGRVVGPDGRPLAGARLAVRRDEARGYTLLDRELARARPALVAEATADERGEFAIALPPGRPFDLYASSEGFATAVLGSRYAGEQVEMRLDVEAVFAGRVVRADDGRPVAGALVRGWIPDRSSLELLRDATDAEGRFRCAGLAAGPLRVEVAARGLADPLWLDLELVAGSETRRDFALRPGYLVRGRVTDARSGAPIPGALVSQGWTFEKTVSSDANGEYAFAGFPEEGVYDVHARAAGYGSRGRDLPAARGRAITVDFALEPARRARGRVVGPDGRPVAGVHVAAVASERQGGSHQSDWRSAISDGEGRFALADLRPDLHHALFLRREGFGTTVYDLPPAESDLALVELGDVALHAASLVAGVAVDEDGRALAGCAVELGGTNADRGRYGAEQVVQGYVDERGGRTDDLGRWSFADVAPGRYLVKCELAPDVGGSAEVDVTGNGDTTGVRVIVAVGLAISGRVVDEKGEPVAGVMLYAHAEAGGERGKLALGAANGAFRVRGLAPGRYRLQAFPTALGRAGEAPAVGEVFVDAVEAGTAGLEIVLPWAAAVSGTVLDAAGAPVASAIVQARDEQGAILAAATAGADGRFELRIEPGLVVDLCALPPSEDTPAWQERLRQELPEGAARLAGVAAGSADLILALPARR